MKQEKASSTAFTVIQGILLVAQKKQFADLVSDDVVDACRRILGDSTEGKKRLAQLNKPLFKLFALLMEWLAFPGFYLHYVLRKKYIEEVCEKSLAQGYKQIISLGAGFDTLAFRYHKQFTDAHFIEIDHPATSKVKQNALGQLAANLELLAVDLAEHDLEAVLKNHPGFKKDCKTLYICEGVLMYLPPSAVNGLFEKLKSLSGPGTRFVFTAVAPDGSPNDNTSWLLKLCLKILSEPLAWRIERGELAGFVEAQSYQLIEDTEDIELAPKYFNYKPGLKLHRGEYIALAEAC